MILDDHKAQLSELRNAGPSQDRISIRLPPGGRVTDFLRAFEPEPERSSLDLVHSGFTRTDQVSRPDDELIKTPKSDVPARVGVSVEIEPIPAAIFKREASETDIHDASPLPHTRKQKQKTGYRLLFKYLWADFFLK